MNGGVIGIPPWLVNDPRCVLYLRGEGPNGSTRIRDWSSAHKTVTVNGDTHNSTTKIKFPPTSISLDGSGDYLLVGAAADWKFLHDGSNYTFAVVTNTTAFSASQIIFDTTATTTTYSGMFLYITAARAIVWTITHGDGSTPIIQNITANGTYPNDGNFHQIAGKLDYTGSGNSVIYLDGVSVGISAKTGYTPSTSNPYDRLNIGTYSGGGLYYSGNIDEIIFLKDALIPIGEIYSPYRRFVV